MAAYFGRHTKGGVNLALRSGHQVFKRQILVSSVKRHPLNLRLNRLAGFLIYWAVGIDNIVIPASAAMLVLHGLLDVFVVVQCLSRDNKLPSRHGTIAEKPALVVSDIIIQTSPSSRGVRRCEAGPKVVRVDRTEYHHLAFINVLAIFKEELQYAADLRGHCLNEGKADDTVRVYPAVAPLAASFTRSLIKGASGEDVRALQKYLNSKGFTIAVTGPGSLGSETALFGPATEAALARFQKAKGILPAAGFFGPLTREFVNKNP